LNHFKTLTATLMAAIITTSLAGCGGNSQAITVTPPPPTDPTPATAFSGTVKSGSQPLANAAVQLYVAGSTGNGSVPTLLTSALYTDSSGSFTIPANYTCPNSSSQAYLVSSGGNIVAQTSSLNSAIKLVTVLGPCSKIAASAHFVVNEVTTVAAVWALSQFLSPGGNIGASSTNTTGLANAVNTALSLADPTAGTAPGATFASKDTAPIARVNSLANLLNTCVSASAASTACTTLLGASQNTLDAALNIVRHPAANVPALYTQSTTSTAFSPALTKAPSDWTLFVNFTGGNMNYPTTLGLDSSGNIWVASYFYAANTNPLAASVTEFSPIGASLIPNGITGNGLSNVYGLAIDSSNNVWVANQQSPFAVNRGLGSITVLNSSGQPISGTTGYTAGGLNFPSALGMDTDGSVWVVNNGNSSVTHLSSTGTSLSGTSGYGAPTIAFPISIAVDANHNAWVGDQNDGIVNRISQNGSTVTPFNCCSAPNSLAIDQSGNAWIANYGSQSVSEISSAGAILSNNAYPGNGNFSGPQGIAVDGAGNVWVGSFHAPVLTEIAGASSTSPAPGAPISPSAGWAPEAKLTGTYSLAIDASGNLWVTNLFNNSIEEFVGIAAPVKTPLIGPPTAP
jgi:streptogramin lyase